MDNQEEQHDTAQNQDHKLRHYQATFDLIDVDHSGVVSVDEVASAFNLTAENVEEIFATASIDAKKGIRFEQVSVFTNRWTKL
jgi:Ca2+-binding EF-hand superfamily protein